MTNSDFDVRLARHLRSLGRETCNENDVHAFALMSRENAAELHFYMKTEPTVIHHQQKGHSRALARAITSRQFFRARASECLFFFSEAS